MERGEYETVQESKKICTECQSNGMKEWVCDNGNRYRQYYVVCEVQTKHGLFIRFAALKLSHSQYYIRTSVVNEQRKYCKKKSIMNQIITIKLYSNALHLFIFQFGTPMIHSAAIRIIDSTVFTEILMISWSASYEPM